MACEIDAYEYKNSQKDSIYKKIPDTSDSGIVYLKAENIIYLLNLTEKSSEIKPGK